MKKSGILNRELIRSIATLGHTDRVVIADCGLPIPDSTPCIDLSIILGEPPFLRVLEAVMNDVEIEKMTLANEIKSENNQIHQDILRKFKGVKVNYIPHDELKGELENVKAVIRTGEATPFANIVLHAGVIF